MGCTMLGVIAGPIAMGITVFAIETIGHTLYPPPLGTDLADPEALRTLMERLPRMAWVFVVLGWATGSFLGAASGRGAPMRRGAHHRRGRDRAGGDHRLMIPHPAPWMLLPA